MTIMTARGFLESWPADVEVTAVCGWSYDDVDPVEVAPMLETSGARSVFVGVADPISRGECFFRLSRLRALLARHGRPGAGDFELRSGPVAVVVAEHCSAELAGLLLEEATFLIWNEGPLPGSRVEVDCIEQAEASVAVRGRPNLPDYHMDGDTT